MTEKERIEDILSSGIFNADEVQHTDQNNFKSWEFWQILHYTNEEYYYLPDDEIQVLADQQIETEKGIIYCFS